MKRKYVKVQVMLDLETINFIKEVASLSGTDQDTVVNVILAAELLKLERDLNDTGKKGKDKSRDGKPSKKARVAKRRKSR
ncbi:MAG: hypothetical protein A4S09_05115 [Proteobacteria bacterium SG_bin7]|nr:MAG: hypothetical protein A4S09_05115 [Proteobacteria bacterium SG_bin7]